MGSYDDFGDATSGRGAGSDIVKTHHIIGY